MVRDSRTPGTYTVSVFTKAIVRYGANSANCREMVLRQVINKPHTAMSDTGWGRGVLKNTASSLIPLRKPRPGRLTT